MVAKNFDASLALVLKAEGGNVDDPADPGGRTSRGITQRVYDAYRRLLKLPTQDVFDATAVEVDDIYYQSYWEPYCDNLPLGLDYAYFDFAVNAGTHEAMVCLQRAASVAADGVFGPVTRQAVAAAGPLTLIGLYSNQRRGFYRNLHMSNFIKGWLNRADAVQSVAIQMSKGDWE